MQAVCMCHRDCPRGNADCSCRRLIALTHAEADLEALLDAELELTGRDKKKAKKARSKKQKRAACECAAVWGGGGTGAAAGRGPGGRVGGRAARTFVCASTLCPDRRALRCCWQNLQSAMGRQKRRRTRRARR